MKVSEKILKKVEKMEEGRTFRYRDLGVDSEQYEAAIKALVRLEAKGVIKRLAKGLYYKAKQSIFGEIGPREEELLRPYLFDGNKRIAYVTGIFLYNRFGLTTQVPFIIKVASREKRVFANIGTIRVKPVKSYVDVTTDNYGLLEILDVLKDFKKIPDMDKRMGIKIILNLLKGVSDKKKLIKIALKYPARVRAFLGALLSLIYDEEKDIQKLKDSLNLVTVYSLGLNDDILKGVSSWRIK